jgi:hypothetical protein
MGFSKVRPAALVWSMRWLGGLALAGCLTGCVLSERTPVPMSINPYVNEPISAPAKAYLEVAAVQDTRSITDKTVLITISDFEGFTYQNSYVTEKPIAEIFQDGLNSTLQKNGFVAINGPAYALESEITGLKWEASSVPGKLGLGSILSGSAPPPKNNFIATPSVNFDLKDKATGQPMWKQSYDGKCDDTLRGDEGSFFADTVSLAAEDVIGQLIKDPKFRSYFETRATNAP